MPESIQNRTGQEQKQPKRHGKSAHFILHYDSTIRNHLGVHELSLQFSKFFKILVFQIFSFDLFYSEGECFQLFPSKQVLVKIITFKITIYLVIKQNIFEFSSRSSVRENERSAGKSPVCFLVYRDKVRHPSTANFRRKYGRKPPARPTIRAWHKKFMETGSVLQRKGAGRPQISEEYIESVRVTYTRSPKKSIRRASTQLRIPRSTIHKVLHRNL